ASMTLASLAFFSYPPAPPPNLHSFPTRPLPISGRGPGMLEQHHLGRPARRQAGAEDIREHAHGQLGILPAIDDRAVENAIFEPEDRKSTRLNSSHSHSSYAAFSLKQKNKKYQTC